MKLVFRFLVVAFAVLVVPAVYAADSPKKSPSTETPAKKEGAKKSTNADTLPFYGKVVSITTRTLTIVRSDAPDAAEVKFSINASTEYVNGDKPSSIDAVKPGAWVGGAAKKASEGNDVVVKLNVGVKQKTKGKAPAKGKGKTESAKKKSE